MSTYINYPHACSCNPCQQQCTVYRQISCRKPAAPVCAYAASLTNYNSTTMDEQCWNQKHTSLVMVGGKFWPWKTTQVQSNATKFSLHAFSIRLWKATLSSVNSNLVQSVLVFTDNNCKGVASLGLQFCTLQHWWQPYKVNVGLETI